jgi:hypothetical protein
LLKKERELNERNKLKRIIENEAKNKINKKK